MLPVGFLSLSDIRLPRWNEQNDRQSRGRSVSIQKQPLVKGSSYTNIISPQDIGAGEQKGPDEAGVLGSRGRRAVDFWGHHRQKLGNLDQGISQ